MPSSKSVVFVVCQKFVCLFMVSFVVRVFVVDEFCLFVVSSLFKYSVCLTLCLRFIECVICVFMFSGNWCSLDRQNEWLDCTKRFVASK